MSLSSAYYWINWTNWAFLVLLLQGCILCITTATSSAGSTPQASASNPPTTTLRRCGTEAVRLVRLELILCYFVHKRSRQTTVIKSCYSDTIVPKKERTMWYTEMPLSQLFCVFSSCFEFPDTWWADGPKPGQVPAEWSVWVHPEGSLHVSAWHHIQPGECWWRSWPQTCPAHCPGKLALNLL